jgi:hypothetical protein
MRLMAAMAAKFIEDVPSMIQVRVQCFKALFLCFHLFAQHAHKVIRRLVFICARMLLGVCALQNKG